MTGKRKFRHEDVATVPKGYQVRTVTHPSGHKVRLAFPPGPRRAGSGQLVSILHPLAGANPCPNPCDHKFARKNLEEVVKDSKGRAWGVSLLSSGKDWMAEGYPIKGHRVGRPIIAHAATESAAMDKLTELIDRKNPGKKSRVESRESKGNPRSETIPVAGEHGNDFSEIPAYLRSHGVDTFWSDRIIEAIRHLTLSEQLGGYSAFKILSVNKDFPLKGAFKFQRLADRKKFSLHLKGDHWVANPKEKALSLKGNPFVVRYHTGTSEFGVHKTQSVDVENQEATLLDGTKVKIGASAGPRGTDVHIFRSRKAANKYADEMNTPHANRGNPRLKPYEASGPGGWVVWGRTKRSEKDHGLTYPQRKKEDVEKTAGTYRDAGFHVKGVKYRTAPGYSLNPKERTDAWQDIDFRRIPKSARFPSGALMGMPPTKKPKAPRKGKNLDEIQEAQKLYETFQGKESTGVVDLHEPDDRRDDFAMLGWLISLTIQPRTRDEEIQLTFRNDKVRLASNAEGTQLYLLGGSQDLNGCLKQFQVDESKDLVELGEAKKVVYLARKAHSNFEPIEWEHTFGEEGGIPPFAHYNRLQKRIFLTGGTYKMEKPGIID